LLRQAISQVRIATSFTLDDGERVTWMLAHFARTHVSPEVLRLAKKHEAMDRDGYLCSMPHCRRMVFLNEHHRHRRSAGGSDDPSNLVSLCDRCHHRLVHGGKVHIAGMAPDGLTFRLGLTPGRDPDRETYRAEIRGA